MVEFTLSVKLTVAQIIRLGRALAVVIVFSFGRVLIGVYISPSNPGPPHLRREAFAAYPLPDVYHPTAAPLCDSANEFVSQFDFCYQHLCYSCSCRGTTQLFDSPYPKYVRPLMPSQTLPAGYSLRLAMLVMLLKAPWINAW